MDLTLLESYIRLHDSDQIAHHSVERQQAESKLFMVNQVVPERDLPEDSSGIDHRDN
jgi:hypothetical protein